MHFLGLFLKSHKTSLLAGVAMNEKHRKLEDVLHLGVLVRAGRANYK